LQQKILQELKLKYEGKCSGRYGYTILIVGIVDVSNGELHADTGFALFNVKYNCIVFRPFKNEILPAVVTQITNAGFFASAGPLEIFVSRQVMPKDYEYQLREDQLPCYFSQEEDAQIEAGALVRVKLVGVRLDQDQIIVIGSIAEDYLGR
jgi:DNA-directed RNA polymerase II subunit RPB7